MDQAIVEVCVCWNTFSLGPLGVLAWLLTTLLAMVVISKVFFKVGNVNDFAFFKVCVVHGRCKSFRV